MQPFLLVSLPTFLSSSPVLLPVFLRDAAMHVVALRHSGRLEPITERMPPLPMLTALVHFYECQTKLPAAVRM